MDEKIISGHDVSSGGLITSLLEMCFPTLGVGMEIDLTSLMEKDTTALLFAENSGWLLQSEMDLTSHFSSRGIDCHSIGSVTASGR